MHSVIECAICKEEINHGGETMGCKNSKSKHIYHGKCITRWILMGRKSCHVCTIELPSIPPHYYKKYDEDGYNFIGYDRDNFDREGYNPDGYDGYGCDKDGKDRDRYNHKGFNRDGFDRQGYNKKGYDKDSFDPNIYVMTD
jgi:hypothetical protein